MVDVLSSSDPEEIVEVWSGRSPLQIEPTIEHLICDTEPHDEGFNDDWFTEDGSSGSSDGIAGDTMGMIPSI
jgi:hypothetical protein